MLSLVDFLEWTGTVFSLIGAFLLAFNFKFSRWGWVSFLFANFTMLLFAQLINRSGLSLQQVGFIASSVVGLIRSGFFEWTGFAWACGNFLTRADAVLAEKLAWEKRAIEEAGFPVGTDFKAAWVELTQRSAVIA